MPADERSAADGDRWARRDGLIAALAAAWDAGQKSTEEGAAETAALRERLQAAVDAWPALQLSRGTFLQHVATGLVASGPDVPIDRVMRLRLADLYLACACLDGQSPALRELQELLRSVPATVRSSGNEATFADDVRALAAERLLTAAAGKRPKLALYRGESSLRAWLTVVVQRIALELRQAAFAEQPTASLDDFSSLLEGRFEPELELLRAKFAPQLQAALRQAAGQLSRRERLLLRLSLVQGLGTRQIAESYRVNQSTVARWIGRSLDRLGQEVRESLRQDCDLRVSDVDSIIAAVRSRMELSLTGLLAATGSHPEGDR